METAKKIVSVSPGSIAEEMEIEPGDELLSIGGTPIRDIFDYMFLTQDTYLEVLVRKASGEEWLLEIEKEEEEDLGLSFDSGLMDDYQSCRNRCIFCFIDQMPPGMRETLYFKDDDSRLSFLQGNYVTLTNMSMDDLDRIIRYHMSPINISFHTMNPQLRCRMLHNRFAGDVLEKAEKLADAGITMNGQIVLCRGINDGQELEYSLDVLSGLYPALQSVSVVPVGLTRFREGLYPLVPFEKEDAEAVLDRIGERQKKMRERYGTGFVYASDEWYLKAGRPIPPDAEYDGYPQLENGVGMMRLLEEEVRSYLEEDPGSDDEAEVSVATGQLAGALIRSLANEIQKKYPNLTVRVYEIRNDFFGEQITVSGLVTGGDLIAQLKGRKLGDRLLIPVNMLRAGEEVFLDDVAVRDVEKALKVPVLPVGASGEAFCSAVIRNDRTGMQKRRQIYEQTDCSNCGQA